MDTGAIVGIVLGAVALALIVGFMVYRYWWKPSRAKSERRSRTMLMDLYGLRETDMYGGDASANVNMDDDNNTTLPPAEADLPTPPPEAQRQQEQYQYQTELGGLSSDNATDPTAPAALSSDEAL